MNGPQYPNPTATATTQTQFNMVGHNTPGGNLTYNQSGKWPDGTPRYTATTSLSPQMQRLFDQQMSNQQKIGQQAGQQAGNMNLAGISQPNYQTYGSGPNLNTTGGNANGIQMNLGSNDFSGERQRVEDALMGRLNTQLDRDRSSIETRLANQGVRPGTEAWRRAQSEIGENSNSARTSAILNAGQEQNRMQQLALNSGNFANAAQNQRFGQQFANAGFGNDARQQMFSNRNQTTTLNNGVKDARFNNAMTGNMAQINQLMAMMNGSQMQNPNLSNMAPGTDFSGLAQAQFQNQQNQWQNNWNAAGNLAGTLGGWFLSDKRAKTDIETVGEGPDGIPLKTFRYKGSPMMHLGHIAQDVQKKRPDAVKRTPGGLMAVNYGKLKKAA